MSRRTTRSNGGDANRPRHILPSGKSACKYVTYDPIDQRICDALWDYRMILTGARRIPFSPCQASILLFGKHERKGNAIHEENITLSDSLSAPPSLGAGFCRRIDYDESSQQQRD